MKRGYLGAFESGFLAGTSMGVQEHLEEVGFESPQKLLGPEKLLFVSAFQGGIQEFITQVGYQGDASIDKFISTRTRFSKNTSETLLNLSKLVSFDAEDEKSKKASAIIHFIGDLICAMQNDASVINASGIPTVSDAEKYLHPELAIPVSTILGQFVRTEELLPAPTMSVTRENVQRFQEIFDSDIYENYSNLHRNLELSHYEPTGVIQEIRAAGSSVLNVGGSILAKRRVSMNVLKIVPKVVDAAFGKLPGTIAQLAGDTASSYMDKEKTIVVYQFEDWVNEYVMALYNLTKS